MNPTVPTTKNRLLSLAKYALAIFALIGLTQPSRAATLDFGIDPYNIGKGEQIYILSQAEDELGGYIPSVTNTVSLMNYLASQGMQWVTIKAGTGGHHFPSSGSRQLTTNVIAAAHNAGLKIFAYTRSMGTNIPAEIALAVDYLSKGCDGFIIDAEAEWESHNLANGPALAIQLCEGIRAAYPTRFLAHAPAWKISVHSSFPYKEFGYYCDTTMPQTYWYTDSGQQRTPQEQVDQFEAEWESWHASLTGKWTNAIKPLAPIGSAWNTSQPASQLRDFVNALKNSADPETWKGYKGISWWRAGGDGGIGHTAAMWNAIGTNNVYATNGPTLYTVHSDEVFASAAGIYWDTDISANTVVEYGLTTGYGSISSNSAVDIHHYAVLYNLSPSTTYHYRVKSTDTQGKTTTSGDFTFVTTAAGAVTDVIIESRQSNGSLTSGSKYSDSGFSNSNLKSSAAGLSGSSTQGSRFATTGTPEFSVYPVLAVPGGTYTVHMSHGVATSISDDITVAVTQTGATGLPATTTIFREPNGNTWELLGTMTLNAGVAKPTLQFAHSSGTISRMYADAIKFVYVPSAPVITTQPQSQTANYSQAATYTVETTGSLPLTYQWRKNTSDLSNGGNISGATSSALTVSSLTAPDAANYTVVISNSVGVVTSVVATLTVQNPAILAQPQSVIADLGGTSTFSVTATGTPTLTYQWRKGASALGDGGSISGASSSALTISGIVVGDEADYSVIVNNGSGSVTSSVATLAVSDPPVITVHPVGSTNNAGAAATLNVTATGSNLSYQWRRDGNNLANGGGITGATSSALTITGITQVHAGEYTVLVSNSAGNDTSDPAVVAVKDGTYEDIIVDNLDAAVVGSWATGSSAGFYGSNYRNTGGTGTGADHVTFTPTIVSKSTYEVYEWHVAGTNRTTIAPHIINYHGGSTTVTVNQQNNHAQWNLIGTYTFTTGSSGYVRITDNFIENAMQVMADAIRFKNVGSIAPQIVTPPTSQTNLYGTTAVFSVLPSGTGPFTYQWKKGGSPLSNVGNVSGANLRTLSLSNVTLTDAANYSVVISNSAGNITSGTVSLTVQDQPPAIEDQPLTQIGAVGGEVNFTVGATGTSLVYQWRKNTVNLNNGGRITGADSPILAISALESGDAGNYDLVLTNSAGSVTSEVAVLTVAIPPSIVQAPNDTNRNAAASVTFTVSANGSAPLTYQWKKNGDDLANGGKIAGATSAALTINSLLEVDEADYTVTINNAAGSITSDPATLTVNDPAITTQPVSTVKTTGATATFTVAATGTPTLTYQWRKAAALLSDGGNISGATSTALTISNVQVSDAANYSVIVTSDAGAVTSSIVSLGVGNPNPVVITKHPVQIQNKTVGQSVAFSVTATGPNPSYQWRINNNDVAGATGTSWSVSPILADYIGANGVTVVVSNTVNAITSNPALFTVLQDTGAPIATIASPGNLKSFTNLAAYTLSIGGKATDNARVEKVFYAINDASFTQATLTTTNGASVFWTNLNVPVVPGTNTLRVYAQDYSTNNSVKILTNKFYFDVWSPFNIAIDTDPTVASPGTNNGFIIKGSSSALVGTNDGSGHKLLVGRTYKLTITQNFTNGYIFTNWSAAWQDHADAMFFDYKTNNSLVLNYTMQTNMTLTAHYVTNQFRVLQGLYDGLFAETGEGSATRHDTAGHINIKVTERLTFTGKLLLDGDGVGFSGKFNINGTASVWGKRLKLANKSDVLVTLNLDLLDGHDGTEQITGTVQGTNNSWTAPFVAKRATFGKVWEKENGTNIVNPTPIHYTNAYTMALPGFADENDGPVGWSHGSVAVNGVGNVITTFSTADHQKQVRSAKLAKDGSWPFFQQLYLTTNTVNTNNGMAIRRFRGILMGTMQLQTNNESLPGNENLAPLGNLVWIKTGWTNNHWQNGFTNDAVEGVPVISSVHKPKPNLTPLYANAIETNFIATISGGGFETFDSQFTLKVSNNSFTYNNKNTNGGATSTEPYYTNKFTILLANKLGTVTGTFTNAPNRSIKWFAVMLQDYTNGYGYYIATNITSGPNGGKVEIQHNP